jgi:hypothetical protein
MIGANGGVLVGETGTRTDVTDHQTTCYAWVDDEWVID